MTVLLLAAALACGLADLAAAKVYDRCELARELTQRHGVPRDEVAVWVCIARHESEFNTTAVGHAGEGGDHGLFQVSDLYWCSHRGRGKACGLACTDLLDDDIADDVACARRIHREHQGLSGNGFNAWAVYPRYCKRPERALEYVDGCFPDTGNELVPQPFYGLPPPVPAITAPPPPPARHRPRPTTPAPTVAVRTFGRTPATPRPYTRWLAPAPAPARGLAPAPARGFAPAPTPARAFAFAPARGFAPAPAPARTFIRVAQPTTARPASDPSNFWNWQFLSTRRWF